MLIRDFILAASGLLVAGSALAQGNDAYLPAHPAIAGAVEGDLDLLGNNITDSTQPIEFGAGCSTSHALGANAGLFCGALEVDGTLWADGQVTHAGVTLQTAQRFEFYDNIGLHLGTGSSKGAFFWDTNQTVDAVQMLTDNTGRYWFLSERADYGYDFGHSAQTNPTLFIQSANQSQTEWLSLAHNQSRGLITTGAGALALGTDAASGHSLGAGDVITGGSLEVDGTLWIDGITNMNSSSGRISLTNGATTEYQRTTTNATSQGIFNEVNMGVTSGGNWVLSSYTQRNKIASYLLGQSTNPTLWVFADVDPSADATNWLSLEHNQTNAVIDSGKGGVQFNDHIIIPEISTPTATADYGALYTKTDNILYFQDGAGAEHPIGGATTVFKSYSHTTGALGTHWMAGFYEGAAADANLTQASPTQTMGTAASGARGARAAIVAGGPGSVDAGTVSIVVSGTSITEAGVRTTSDSETLVADITAMSLNDYYETSKKWLGQVTFTLTPAGATTYSADFNYLFAKHEDYGNIDFTVTDFECVWEGGATDTGIDIELLHHKTTGWTYHATAFVPGDGAVASCATDYSTDCKVVASEYYSYKRAGLSTAVDGSGQEGVLIRLTTTANNALDAMDCHIGVRY